MAKSEIIECKLPKGRKWSDKEVIKESSPYCARYGGQLFCPHGKYCCFYPIEEDLYIKGMFSYQRKAHFKHDDGYYTEGYVTDKNIIVKLTNYKNLTGIEAWNILSEQVFTESMILSVWNKLGLRLGYTIPILKDLR